MLEGEKFYREDYIRCEECLKKNSKCKFCGNSFRQKCLLQKISGNNVSEQFFTKNRTSLPGPSYQRELIFWKNSKGSINKDRV